MNLIKTAIAAAAMAFALNSGAAVAQTATGTAPATTTKPAVTTPPMTAPTAPKAKIGVPKTEISAQCSKEADEKKLHGAERKKFRAGCMKAAEKAKAAGSTMTAPATTAPAAGVAPAKKN